MEAFVRQRYGRNKCSRKQWPERLIACLENGEKRQQRKSCLNGFWKVEQKLSEERAAGHRGHCGEF